MTFHKRCTLFFLDLFSILALIALGVEIIGPWMVIENKDKCYGITYECSACPLVSANGKPGDCDYALNSRRSDKKKFLISLIAASVAGSLIAIMTVFALLLSCGSCRGSPSCSQSMYRFTLAYILLDILALIANIAAMVMWVLMGKSKNLGPSFWLGWVANALLLVLLVILIILRTREAKAEGYGDNKSQTSADQPLFRSLYHMTPTTVFHDRP